MVFSKVVGGEWLDFAHMYHYFVLRLSQSSPVFLILCVASTVASLWYLGPLLEHIAEKSTFSESEVIAVTGEISDALDFLHSHGKTLCASPSARTMALFVFLFVFT